MGLSSGEVAEEVTGGSGPGAERALEANNQSPRAKREVRSSPELPCERRPRPAEPRRGTYPQRQPQHSATAKKVRVPGCMRRSFRTHRLCAIPGVSPRAGIRCPVGALRTPHLPQSPHRLHVPSAPAPQRPSAITTKHRVNDDSPRVYAAFLQNAPVVRHTRGFTPGWYALPRWGTPNASPFPEPPPPPRPQRPSAPAPSPQNTGSTTIVFLNGDYQTTPIEGHTPNPRSGSGIGPERA
jgi:hypothetical protein